MAYKKLVIILGNCLFPNHRQISDPDSLFFMAEDAGLCTHFPYHKQKLVLFLSAMRSHADQIRKHSKLIYWKLDPQNIELSYEDKLYSTLNEHPDIEEIISYEIEDHFFEQRIKNFCREQGLKHTILPSESFVTTTSEFKDYLSSVRKPFMHTFYQSQRRRLGILLNEDGSPLNGKWSFDDENRKKLPKGVDTPSIPISSKTQHTNDVIRLVEELFPSNPGNTNHFFWSTTRQGALDQFNTFIEQRFVQFGPYEDAIDKESVFLFHSVLSPYLNLGLITPTEIIDRVIEVYSSRKTHFPSVEGFIRQIIGWREFIRGIYHEYDNKLNVNYLNHHRKMNDSWYTGDTGIEPLDDSIRKALKYGYTHHIERLMILGNIMLLCEINPDEVYRWFMMMYVDSSDWVMAPNVFGMSQFADGGIFATKPYIGGASYILKMSNYDKKADWIDTINGLYWRFIDKHRDLFSGNPRMAMMPKLLDKMDDKKREYLFDRANKLIGEITH